MTTKDEIRKRVWDYMERHNIARFPRPVHGRIPNFEGAERAAEKLTATDEWRDAKVIKSNPDSAQQPIRERALSGAKMLHMAVPRLSEEKCFIELRVDKSLARRASTIKGAFEYGRHVAIPEMSKVDLIVAGSVAVNRDGTRLGKGGGYSDLEFALAREFGLVDDSTPIVTTVHTCQIIDEPIPRQIHDEVLDLIVTTRETIRVEDHPPKPRGIYWDLLTEEKIAEIPVLKSLREKRGS